MTSQIYATQVAGKPVIKNDSKPTLDKIDAIVNDEIIMASEVDARLQMMEKQRLQFIGEEFLR